MVNAAEFQSLGHLNPFRFIRMYITLRKKYILLLSLHCNFLLTKVFLEAVTFTKNVHNLVENKYTKMYMF